MRNALLATLLTAAPALPVHAAIIKTFTVNSASDAVDANPGDGSCATSGGTCTLRAAVMEANHTGSGTTKIVLPANAESYELSIAPANGNDEATGDLNITRDTTIVGAGSELSVVSGTGVDRLFIIEAGVSATISDVDLSGGSPATGGGGAIRNLGSLTVSRCRVAGNIASSGGGIQSDGNLTVLSSVFELNFAIGTGSSGNGGGIVVVAGTTNVVNTTINRNSSARNGGGIACFATCSLFNVTVSQNVADYDHDDSGVGGGIANAPAGTFSLANSIVSGNLTRSIGNECVGTFQTSFDIFSVGQCTNSGGVTVTDPLLGSLHAAGGPTVSQPLLPGSPAIDAGDPAGCKDHNGATLAFDQRGAHRPAGAACDLGAYEANANGDANGDGTRSVTDVFVLINFLFAGAAAPAALADVNGDRATDVQDVFLLINFLFAGGPAPR
jgi:CSLREA domain-containing protein